MLYTLFLLWLLGLKAPVVVQQGNPVAVQVTTTDRGVQVRSARFMGQPVPLVWYRGQRYALVPVAVDAKPGSYPLLLELPYGQDSVVVEVVAAGFRVRHLYPKYPLKKPTVPPLPLPPDTNKPFFRARLNDWQAALPNEVEGFTLPIDSRHLQRFSGLFGDKRYWTRQQYHERRPKRHYGLDFVADTGTAVRAIGSGVVRWADDAWLRDDGVTVVVFHTPAIRSVYQHLARVCVVTGDTVRRGQVLGYIGNTGSNSKGPHLDIKVKVVNVYVHPLRFIEAFPPSP